MSIRRGIKILSFDKKKMVNVEFQDTDSDTWYKRHSTFFLNGKIIKSTTFPYRKWTEYKSSEWIKTGIGFGYEFSNYTFVQYFDDRFPDMDVLKAV